MSAESKIEWTDTTWRAAKTAARRIRVSLDDYVSLVQSGQKFCWRCRLWRSRDQFGVDRSRGDGLASMCTGCRKPPRQLPLAIDSPAHYARRRYATNADYRFRRQQHAYARRRGVDAVPPEGCEALAEQFGGLCAYCGNPADTWDHIVPVAAGGRTAPGNVLPACRSCNSRKGTRDVYDFIEAAGVSVSAALDDALALALEWGQLHI